jgi:hypothetical protein
MSSKPIFMSSVQYFKEDMIKTGVEMGFVML